jgi:hypothetical protein
MRWTRLAVRGDRRCATATCCSSASWSGEAGDVASDYCSECKDVIDQGELVVAARAVVAFDWSDNDQDAVSAIDRLRRALENH